MVWFRLTMSTIFIGRSFIKKKKKKHKEREKKENKNNIFLTLQSIIRVTSLVHTLIKVIVKYSKMENPSQQSQTNQFT